MYDIVGVSVCVSSLVVGNQRFSHSSQFKSLIAFSYFPDQRSIDVDLIAYPNNLKTSYSRLKNIALLRRYLVSTMFKIILDVHICRESPLHVRYQQFSNAIIVSMVKERKSLDVLLPLIAVR